METKNFDPKKSHEENISISIEKILGQKTVLRKTRRTKDTVDRGIFTRIIVNLIAADDRSIYLETIINMNMNHYNNIFYDIINDFFQLYFTQSQIKIINFFLYDRYNADGTVSILADNDNNPIKLDTPDELWEFLKNYK